MTFTGRSFLVRSSALLLGAVVLTGCTQNSQGSQMAQEGVASPAAGEPPVSECDSAFAAASSAAPGPQRDEDLWATFDVCADLDEFAGAAAVYPDALSGDVEEFVRSACADEPAVEGTTLCAAAQPEG